MRFFLGLLLCITVSFRLPGKMLRAEPTVSSPSRSSETVAKARPWLDRKIAKIAAAQIDVGEGADPIGKMEEYSRRAGKEKCDMIVFPEYLLGAFSLEGEPTGNLKRLADAAKAAQLYVVVGGWQDLTPGAYAAQRKNEFTNTTVLIDRQGKVMGTYSKTHRAIGPNSPHFWPPEGNEPEWLMKAGDGFPTFQLDFARIGIMTCYDGYFPESATALSLQGAEIVLWNNGRGGSIETYLVKADMYRNYCAMVATNLGVGAGTMIGTWPNTILAHVPETGSHYISAEIDLVQLRWRRANSRTFHQRRPEIYHDIVTEHQPWDSYPKSRVEAPNAD